MGVASVKLTEVANRAGAHIPPSGATSLLRKRCFASSGRRLSGVVERVFKGLRERSDVAVACRRDVRQRSGRRHTLPRPARQPSPALEHEIDLDTVVEIGQTSSTAVISLPAAIEQRCRRWSALRTRRPSCRLRIGAAPCGRSSHPPQGLIDAFAEKSHLTTSAQVPSSGLLKAC